MYCTESRTITVDYGTHQYDHTYEHSPNMYCPGCGKQNMMWVETEGDYYQGCTHLCLACGSSGALMEGYGESIWTADMQAIEQLRKLEEEQE